MIQFLVGVGLGYHFLRKMFWTKAVKSAPKRIENKASTPAQEGGDVLQSATPEEIEKAVSNVEDYYEAVDAKPKPSPKPIKAKASVMGKAPQKPAPKKVDIKVPEKPKGFKGGSMDDLMPEDDPIERSMENDSIEGAAPLEDKPEDDEEGA